MSPTREQLTALAVAGLLVTAIVVGAIVYFALRVRGSGRIKLVGIKAFSDPAATLEISAIDWGEISPGGYAYTTIYLKSTSTVPSNLTMHTEAWDPLEAETFIHLTWDYDGRDLSPGEIIGVTLTLSVDDAITGIIEFAFDIVITAAG